MFLAAGSGFVAILDDFGPVGMTPLAFFGNGTGVAGFGDAVRDERWGDLTGEPDLAR